MIRRCRHAGRFFIAAAAIWLAPAGAAATERSDAYVRSPDPLALYGPKIEFDVFRKGARVGFHRVRFERVGNELRVTNTFQVEVGLLFVTAYRYVYQSDSLWRDGRLVHLRATVDDNGKRSLVEASHDGIAMTVRADDASAAFHGSLYPTNHWNSAVLGQTRVLNTLHGRINEVRIIPEAREAVPTERGPIMATRYAYTGELDATVWYDDAGRWVKLRFAGRDGSLIEYACRRCQGADGPRAANG